MTKAILTCHSIDLTCLPVARQSATGLHFFPLTPTMGVRNMPRRPVTTVPPPAGAKRRPSGLKPLVELEARPKRCFQTRLLKWYRQYGRDLPWRKTSDPYRILVSEVMLQQTQV